MPEVVPVKLHASGPRGGAVRPPQRDVRVTLVKPPLRVPTTAYGTLRCPPIGLAYIAATLETHGIHVAIVDAVGEDPRRVTPDTDPHFVRVGLSDEELLARIPPETTILGVSCMFSEEWPLTRHIIKLLRRAHPDAVIVGGGEHITAAAEFSMRDSAAVDVCVHGEGEETFAHLVETIRDGGSLDAVPGISFLDHGTYRRTERRVRMREIDRIPRPAWHKLPLRNYLDNGFGYGIGRVRSYPMLASRGCPFDCTFCSSPEMWTTRWYARNPEDVIDEMQWAIDTYQVENFDFYDLTAIVRKDWIQEFCRRLIERRLGTTWQLPVGTRSEALVDDVLPLLRESGCSYMAYAPESGSPAVLARIRKKVKLDRMTASMRQAVAAGLTVKCNFVMGFPGETPGELWETVRFCNELAGIGIHDVNVGPFCPYPGSALFEQLQQEGLLGALDDKYFTMLSLYADLTRSRSWSQQVSDRQLMFFRYAAMTTFYGHAFARRPTRAFAVVRNVYSGRHASRLDRNVADILDRWRSIVHNRA